MRKSQNSNFLTGLFYFSHWCGIIREGNTVFFFLASNSRCWRLYYQIWKYPSDDCSSSMLNCHISLKELLENSFENNICSMQTFLTDSRNMEWASLLHGNKSIHSGLSKGLISALDHNKISIFLTHKWRFLDWGSDTGPENIMGARIPGW